MPAGWRRRSSRCAARPNSRPQNTADRPRKLTPEAVTRKVNSPASRSAGSLRLRASASLNAALIAALAGLALYGAFSEALARSLSETAERDTGLFTFLVTASGVSFLGLSAAFWGLLFGLAAHLLLRLRKPAAIASPAGEPARE